MENKLIDLYRGVLESVGCVVEDDGFIYHNYKEGREPVQLRVDGKLRKMALPIHSILKDADWDEVVAFHPACESVFKGNSEVLNWLIDVIAIRLYRVSATHAATILALATDTKEHQKLKAKQLTMLSVLGDAKPTALKYLGNIFKRSTGTSGKYPMLSIRIRRGEVVDGAKYSRVCRLIPKVTQGGDPIFDVNDGYTQANGKVIRALFDEIIFPEDFVAVTNKDVAPSLRVLLEMYYEAASHLNELRQLMAKQRGAMEVITTEWFADLESIAEWKKLVGVELPGNTGISKRESEERTEVPGVPDIRVSPSQGYSTQHTPAVQPAPPQPQYVQPQAMVAAPQQPQRPMTIEEMANLGTQQQTYYQQPVYSQPPPAYPQPQSGYQQPQLAYNPYGQLYAPQPGYPQPSQPPQPPQPVYDPYNPYGQQPYQQPPVSRFRNNR